MTAIHVVAALIALVSGAVALAAPKGARVHRGSGRAFAYSMLVMTSTGALLGALQPNLGNVMGGVLTFYLTLTGLLAVRRPVLEYGPPDAVATTLAVAVCGLAGTRGLVALGGADKDGVPAGVYFMFGGVALLAALGDVRLIRGRRLQGGARLTRHLWRMCLAFWIATASFFLGPSRRLPAVLRHSPLRPIPVLLVLAVMVYWLVRVRARSTRLPTSEALRSPA